MKAKLYPWGYTHAAFPVNLFDEIVDELEEASRIAARIGDGYIALFSASAAGSARMVTEGTYANREIVAGTGVNGTAAWACVVGTAEEHGDFANFVASVMRDAVFEVADWDTMATALRWSGGRTVTFGWSTPLVVVDPDGTEERSTDGGFRRYDSPYSQVAFPATGPITSRYGDIEHVVDFDTGTRATRAVAAASRSNAETTTAIAVSAAILAMIGIAVIIGARRRLHRRRQYRDNEDATFEILVPTRL